MDRKHNKSIVPYAKELRKNMTKEENHLWYDFLREYPVRFSRQKVLGKYIADFYCAKAKLIVELDGAQHFKEDGRNMTRKELRIWTLTTSRYCGSQIMTSTEIFQAYVNILTLW